MRVKLFILLLLPVIANAQFPSRSRPIIIPQRDSSREMEYQINSKVFNNGVTESINLFNVRNGYWLSIPQDTLMLAKYRGRNDGSIDTIMHLVRGNVRASPKSQLALSASQITGLFSGSYNDLTNKPAIPTARPDSTIYYNSSGRIHQRIKKWVGRVSITNGSGQSIDISSAGFGTITSISVLAEKNATTAPNVSVKSYTTSAVVLNVKEENNAVVQILGINVLSGAPLIFATGTVWAWVTIEGY